MVDIADRGHPVILHMRGWREQAVPDQITDRQGRRWSVIEILDHRIHPDYGRSGADPIPHGVEVERWHLIIDGPLPYRRGRGEQQVAVRSYGDGSGPYLIPTQPPSPGAGQPPS